MGISEHVFSLVSVVWLISSLFTTGSQAVKLYSDSEVKARCGDNVTLSCLARSTNQMAIRSFLWMSKGGMECIYANSRLDYKGQCEKTPQNTLMLTLPNVMPINEGNYLCKIVSTTGQDHSTTDVVVQDCFGSSNSSINSTQAKCWFTGVYPLGTIHWYKGDVNLTDSAITENTTDTYNRYNIWSSIEVEQKSFNQTFQCCLRRPSAEEDQCQTLELSSTGHMAQVQWICVIMGILLKNLA